MMQDASSHAGDNLPEFPSPAEARLEHLICALVDLRANISRVEEIHPTLRTDLSSVCELAISHLKRPNDSPVEPQALPACDEPPAAVMRPPTSLRRGSLASAFDRAGDGLVSGLDRMGDGVIFVFDRLLSLGSRRKAK
jgi:hypothetical protein